MDKDKKLILLQKKVDLQTKVIQHLNEQVQVLKMDHTKEIKFYSGLIEGLIRHE